MEVPARTASRPALPWGRRETLVCLGLLAANVAVFGRVSGFEFLDYDDNIYVSDNVHIRDGLTWSGLKWAFTVGYASNWHPLTWLSHMADVELFGLDPGAHHLVNLLLHTVNTLLLFGLLWRLTGATWRSAFVAALFAVHPLHVESVAWVAERKDVLSTMFWMLTLWAYALYARAPTAGRYALVAACLALGLMAKPMLVSLPLVLLLMDIWPLGRATIAKDSARVWARLIAEKLPLLALAAASSLLTVVAQRYALMELSEVPASLRVTNAVASYAAYIVKMFWPAELVAIYPLPESIPRAQVLVGALLLLVAISFGVARVARRHPVLLVGWLWYLVTLVPVIGLVQVGPQAMADRYTYVPLIGLFLVIAWGVPEALGRWARRSQVLGVAATASVVACAVLAFQQTRHWKDSRSLWTHAIRETPDNYVAHRSLGYVDWTDGNADEAISHYTESLRLRPDYLQGLISMGVALSARGRIQEAITYLAEAVRVKPENAVALQNLRAAQQRLGEIDSELTSLGDAARATPDDLGTRNRYGAALVAAGRLEEAVEQFAAAVRIDPEQPDVQYNLGVVLAQLGRTAAATDAFRAALRIDPQHQAAREALRDLTGRPSR
jgi:protein O-mannosyl-transferase